jgi:hypothetical protein
LIRFQRGKHLGESDKWLAAAPASHFFLCPAREWDMLELLGFVLDLLPDFVMEYLLGRLFLGLQELWNWTANKLL